LKRHELIRELVKAGCYLKRHGKRHDIYANPKTGHKAPDPSPQRAQKQPLRSDQEAARPEIDDAQ
jgi:hypothetical protein